MNKLLAGLIASLAVSFAFAQATPATPATPAAPATAGTSAGTAGGTSGATGSDKAAASTDKAAASGKSTKKSSATKKSSTKKTSSKKTTAKKDENKVLPALAGASRSCRRRVNRRCSQAGSLHFSQAETQPREAPASSWRCTIPAGSTPAASRASRARRRRCAPVP